MKVIIPLKPCPWCKKTPYFYLIVSDVTWNPKIYCDNGECDVNPEVTIPICKTSKTDIELFKMKIYMLFIKWNQGNDYPAYEGKEIDFEEFMEKQK